MRPAVTSLEISMDRQNEKTHIVTAQACDQLAQSFIRSALELCEERIRTGNMDKSAKTAIALSAMNARYAIRTLLTLIEQDTK